jgi:hypothetical protein
VDWNRGGQLVRAGGAWAVLVLRRHGSQRRGAGDGDVDASCDVRDGDGSIIASQVAAHGFRR